MRTKLSDIARLSGVSKTTASRALSSSTLVNEQTRQRVQRIADELGYVPNALAQAVATKRSGIIGLCIYCTRLPYFAHTFFGPLLDGAIVEAKRHDYHIIVTTTDREDATFDEHFIQDSIDGVILRSFTPRDAVAEFRRRHIPLVLVNDVLDTPNNAFVVQDDYGGALQLMEHLIGRGHRRIAFLGDRLSHNSYFMRYMAYLDAHSRHDLGVYECAALAASDPWGGYPPNDAGRLALYGQAPPDLSGTPIIVQGTDPRLGLDAVRELLRRPNPPTAIFASADSLAIGALRAALEAGLRVPGDIAIAGFDDIDMARSTWPALTTVKAGPFEMGRMAVRELLLQIENPSLESRVRTVPTQLIVREST